MKIFFFLIINIISAIILNQTTYSANRNKLNIFTSIIIYLLIINPTIGSDNYIIVSMICFLMTMIGYYLQIITSSSENKLNVFNVGFLSGICSLCNISHLILLPLIIIWMTFLQKISLRLLIILLLGFFLPFLVLKFDIFSLNISLENMMSNKVSSPNMSTTFSYYHIFMYLIILVSVTEVLKHFKRKKNQYKYMYFIFLLIPLVCNISDTLFSSTNIIIPLVHIKTLLILNYIMYSRYYQFGTILVGLWLITLLIETISI